MRHTPLNSYVAKRIYVCAKGDKGFSGDFPHTQTEKQEAILSQEIWAIAFEAVKQHNVQYIRVLNSQVYFNRTQLIQSLNIKMINTEHFKERQFKVIIQTKKKLKRNDENKINKLW